jgi:hypothetical protein
LAAKNAFIQAKIQDGDIIISRGEDAMKRKTALILALTLALLGLARGMLGAESEPGGEAPEGKPKNAFLPVVLNLLPGLGVGSFVEGDRLGGFICLGGDVAGVGLASFGLGMALVEALAAASGSAFVAILTLGHAKADMSEEGAGIQTGIVLACVGVGIWSGSKVFGLVRPIVFAANYNKKLARAQVALYPACSTRFDSGLVDIDPGLALKLSL